MKTRDEVQDAVNLKVKELNTFPRVAIVNIIRSLDTKWSKYEINKMANSAIYNLKKKGKIVQIGENKYLYNGELTDIISSLNTNVQTLIKELKGIHSNQPNLIDMDKEDIEYFDAIGNKVKELESIIDNYIIRKRKKN